MNLLLESSAYGNNTNATSVAGTCNINYWGGNLEWREAIRPFPFPYSRDRLAFATVLWRHRSPWISPSSQRKHPLLPAPFVRTRTPGRNLSLRPCCIIVVLRSSPGYCVRFTESFFFLPPNVFAPVCENAIRKPRRSVCSPPSRFVSYEPSRNGHRPSTRFATAMVFDIFTLFPCTRRPQTVPFVTPYLTFFIRLCARQTSRLSYAIRTRSFVLRYPTYVFPVAFNSK